MIWTLKVEHSRSGNPFIAISRTGTGGTIQRFLFRDKGQGIPDEILNEVFVPFVKGKVGGTGIGLSIVEKIVRAYNGEMRAHNNNGACFASLAIGLRRE